MSTFDFEEEIERERASALSDLDRAVVRTAISQQRLPDAVRAAGWNFLHQGDEFDPTSQERALVIGLAPWSAAELRALGALLDAADEAVGVWVFNIDDCENADDIARFVPGVKAPIQTPIVADYVNGDLVRSAEGAAAIDLLTHPDR